MFGSLNLRAQSLRVFMALSSFLMMLYVWNDSRLGSSSPQPLLCSNPPEVINNANDLSTYAESGQDEFDVRKYVKGPPTEFLFDNLRNDTLYITTLLDAGWTNDVMTIVNMIYLAMLTGRVPVIPPHNPMHVGDSAGIFPFGEIFDIPRLKREIRYPMIEWRDLKSGIELDYIGCWSQWATSESNESKRPRETQSRFRLHLDPSYTAVPEYTRILNGFHSFAQFARLAFPEGREEALRDKTPFPSPQHGRVIFPNDHLMCFDMLYYVGNSDAFEWEKEWSPAWKFVGKYLHWHPRMAELAQRYAKMALGIPDDAPLPKFISMHIRRGDFGTYCGEHPETCFPPMTELARLVSEVRSEVFAKSGDVLLPQYVLLTSDESDPAWWAEISAQGWSYINHTKERTAEDFGGWYPAFIDAMIHSMGTGFVGTELSTMSLVAGRRVKDWNGGVAKMARFGPGSYPASP